MALQSRYNTGKQKDPDHVDEVPVDAGDFDAVGEALGIASATSACPGPRRYALTIMPAITWIACRPVIVKYSPRKLFVAGYRMMRELVAVLDGLDDEEDARRTAASAPCRAGTSARLRALQRRPRHHHRHGRGDQDDRVQRGERHVERSTTDRASSARRRAAAHTTRRASRTASPRTPGTARSRASGLVSPVSGRTSVVYGNASHATTLAASRFCLAAGSPCRRARRRCTS